MKSIAIIPARAGSKRLPRKNILNFKGKPIIGWTIESAIRTGMFDKIIVSTEDIEISNIAKKFGADVSCREEKLATDTASVNQVCLDVLQKEKCMGRSYEVLCCLYATSPLRDYTDIVNTMELVISNKCKQAMAVTNFDLPAFQAMFYSADGSLTPMRPDLLQLNSNEVEEIVVDNGSTYVTRVKDFILSGSLVSDGMLGYQMPKVRSIDIDTKEDFILAEYYSDATYQ
ncbi:MAG: acylneuraminate cytidylyltransferase family protein [Candidatus Scalindua sp.]|jgi:pseudaminic acid cytidylyltransferase|nr:acylneuraminate cytidylyltransferase family protein [Candidatus Scalindua sp.]